MTTEPLLSKPSAFAVLYRVLASNQMASWAGQGLVSAVNFVVLIALARAAGVAELGYYALGFSILVVTMVTQDSLVTRPYAIQIFSSPNEPEAHAYGALVCSLSLSLAMGLCFAFAGMVMYSLGTDDKLSGLFLILGLTTPLASLRDFARRFSFAHMRMRQAFGVDAAASTILLLLLGALAWQELLGASAALLAIGASGALSATGWLWLNQNHFKKSPGAALQTARQSWSFGKWLLSSQIALQVQGYAAHWITLVVAGAAVTGLYSACLSIVGLANPFLFGLFNMLTPKFVRALKNEGMAGLKRAAFHDALLIGAIMGAFAIVLTMGGGIILPLIFPGEDFAGGQHILSILALSSAVSSMGAPAAIALSAAERGQAIAGLSFVICLLGSVAIWFLLLQWGLLGAVIGILFTESVGAAARWTLLLFGNRITFMQKAPE